jgi:hypothetical protein
LAAGCCASAVAAVTQTISPIEIRFAITRR